MLKNCTVKGGSNKGQIKKQLNSSLSFHKIGLNFLFQVLYLQDRIKVPITTFGNLILFKID